MEDRKAGVHLGSRLLLDGLPRLHDDRADHNHVLVGDDWDLTGRFRDSSALAHRAVLTTGRMLRGEGWGIKLVEARPGAFGTHYSDDTRRGLCITPIGQDDLVPVAFGYCSIRTSPVFSDWWR